MYNLFKNIDEEATLLRFYILPSLCYIRIKFSWLCQKVKKIMKQKKNFYLYLKSQKYKLVCSHHVPSVLDFHSTIRLWPHLLLSDACQSLFEHFQAERRRAKVKTGCHLSLSPRNLPNNSLFIFHWQNLCHFAIFTCGMSCFPQQNKSFITKEKRKM